MTQIKSEINAWVKAGGNLVVMGGQQNAEWLQPFLTSGTRPARGSAFIPDIGHPVLNTPNKLDAIRYPDTANGWQVPNATYSHIITKGPLNQQGDKWLDLLAVSNSGSRAINGSDDIFGNGSVILTTFIGKELSDLFGFPEECKFFANLFMYVVNRNVYLDYGPTIPFGVDVAYSERMSLVDYPKDVWGEMRMVLYVWRGA